MTADCFYIEADVNGKGIPDSLIITNVQAALSSLTPLSLNLNDLVKSINNLLFENKASYKFVIAFSEYLMMQIEN